MIAWYLWMWELWFSWFILGLHITAFTLVNGVMLVVLVVLAAWFVAGVKKLMGE